MARKLTVETVKNILTVAIEKNTKVQQFLRKNGFINSTLYNFLYQKPSCDDVKNQYGQLELDSLRVLYKEYCASQNVTTKLEPKEKTSKNTTKTGNKTKNVDSDQTVNQAYDERAIGLTNRDVNNKIESYTFRIKVRNLSDFTGTLSREEMEKIYGGYSSVGENISAKELSKDFPRYTLAEFKKILRAFNITKACEPFALHTIEERDDDTLVELRNNFTYKRIEKKAINDESKFKDTVIQKLQEELYKYKNGIGIVEKVMANYSTHNFDIPVIEDRELGDAVMNLYLSDMHIGADVDPNCIYENTYNLDVVKSRLQNLLNRLSTYCFDTINVCNLGDAIDGMNQMTTRGGHLLRQNMDNYQQVNNYIAIMDWFFESLIKLKIANKITFKSVKCGNHSGIAEYTASKCIASLLQYKYGIDAVVYDDFFGIFDVNDIHFLISHGKDDVHMKRGLPLNLDQSNEIKIRDFLEDNGIFGSNINIVKGDLHSDNYNSNKKISYRNVLSLFGASDHSAYNYTRNDYGVSYDIIDNGEITRGSFINL